jgi:ubiquinone/menaquinone biosynthesis C-methylase UbiE
VEQASRSTVWLDVSSGAQWLDVGCGTGTLSQTILDIASPKMVVGVEPSEEYIEFARKYIQDPRVSLRLGDITFSLGD